MLKGVAPSLNPRYAQEEQNKVILKKKAEKRVSHGGTHLRIGQQLDHKGSHHHGCLAEETSIMRRKSPKGLAKRRVDIMLLVG